MATKKVYITGVAQWAKVFERNRDKGEFFEETDGATTITLILEKEEQKALKDSGSRLRPKVTDDGITVTFRRPWVSQIETLRGKVDGAPQVVDKDGQPWDTNKNIGNGSLVQVACEVYDTKKGTGTRLTGVKVLDLVEFEGGNSNDDGLPF